ncbi:MAG TPA: protoporphyrinogen oxidase, partial [Opitutus sp.]|nr:protoporphyrinogen oxidase [Opitutus sp.]
LTGLTAAWHLRQAGLSPVVIEKSARVGGAIGAEQSGSWLHELGPNSLLESSPDIAAFIEEVGLGSRRIYASPAARQRYIVRDGRLVAMPTSPMGFVTTKLFSWPAKLALLGEPWRPRGVADREESVADFVVRRLGREFLDYAINPFVGGVYAGDPAALSVRHAFPKLHAIEQEHGSLIRGAIKRRNASGGPKGRMFSFPNGLTELPQALARSLGNAVQLQTAVRAVRRTATGWEIDCANPERSWTESVSAVVSALPADALASLGFQGVAASDRLALLREIKHPPVVSVFTGFRRDEVRHALDGFGALVPQVERGSILGTLFSSTLFPGRAPEGHVALTSFVGGTRQPELAGMDDGEILRAVQGELTRLVGVSAAPVYTHVQRWPRAIPQYTLGYERFKNVMTEFETAAPGFFIGGNARDGISLASCMESGRRLAAEARRFLAENKNTPKPAVASPH